MRLWVRKAPTLLPAKVVLCPSEYGNNKYPLFKIHEILKSFLLNGKVIKIHELINGEYGLEKLTNDEQKTIALIKAWLSGKSEFHFATSGSTGIPKAITHSRDQLQKSARRTMDFFGINSGNTLLARLNTEMIAGAMMVIRALEADCNLIIESPRANPLANLPAETTIDFMAVTPIQMESILQESANSLKYIRTILIGGAGLHPELEGKLQLVQPKIFISYAMTETITHVAVRPVNGPQKSDNYHALAGVTFTINDDSCLVIRDAALGIEQLETNDIVELIDETTFRWLGRRDNIINSGGVKIQVEWAETQIKKILSEHQLHNSFCLCAIPNTKLTNKVVLLYETKIPLEAGKSLLKSMKEKLPKYHAPKEIIAVPKLFLTKSGKMDRIKIQDVYLRDLK